LLSEYAAPVLSVELDPAFHMLARELVGDRPNVRLLHGDALRTKNVINPAIVEGLVGLKQEFGCDRVKLVANLPYAIATPIIANLLLSDVPVERMVVTVQWELAARLMARPDTADYGALAVLVQSLADVELIRKL